MNNLFKAKTARFFVGISFAIASVVITYIFTNRIKAGIIFAILFIVSGFIKVKNNVLSNRTVTILYVVWFVITAFVTCFLSELVLNEQIISLGFFRIALGMIICLFLFLLLYTITLHPILSVSIVTSFLVFGTAVNYYVYHFRGSEVQPADILSITTAGDMAGEYKVVLTTTIIYAFILTIVYLFFSFGLPKITVKSKLKQRAVLGGIDVAVLVLFLILQFAPPSGH